jgi:hypothetical protein
MSHNTKKHQVLGVLFANTPEGLATFRRSPIEIAEELNIPVLTIAVLIKFLKSKNEVRSLFVGWDEGISYTSRYEITEEGMIAYTFGYYHKESLNSLKENIKDIFAILTPILSLVVAIVAILSSSNNNLEDKIEKIDRKIEDIISFNKIEIIRHSLEKK